MSEAPIGTVAISKRVMVVDGHAESIDALGRLLVSRGHQVRTAANNATAMRVAIEFEPEVVIIEVEPHGSPSYSLARQLRLLPGLHAVRLISATVVTNRHVPTEARAEGATFFRCLTRPFPASIVFAAVEDEPSE